MPRSPAALEERSAEMLAEVRLGVAQGALQATEQRILSKAVDDVTNWLANVTVGPIIHAKKEDLEKKQKGLELIFGAFSKKIEAHKAAPPVEAAPAARAAPAAAKPKAPEPVMMLDDGGLD